MTSSWISTEPDPVSAAAPPTVKSVDDFVPDEGLDKSFLEDNLPSNPKPAMNTHPSAAGPADSDRYIKGILKKAFFVNFFYVICHLQYTLPFKSVRSIRFFKLFSNNYFMLTKTAFV